MITIGNLFDKIIKVQQKTIQKINYVALSSTIITYKGNVFNGPSQLVQLDNTGKLPQLDAHNLTNLPLQNYSTTNEISGLISSALLSYIKATDVYTKTEINQITSGLRDQIDKIQAGDVQLTNYYTKGQIETLSGEIVNIFNDYTTDIQLSELLNNKADLISGKIPASQLPSYVDDVIECYFNNQKSKIYSDNNKSTQISIQPGKIYIDLETNKSYRWSGSQFSEISSSLALGETASTAFAGDRGKTLQTEVQQLKTAGYITGYTQSDPIFTANSGKFALTSHIDAISAKIDEIQAGDVELTNYYTKSEIDNKKYLTSYTQSDPIFTANSGKFALTGQINALTNKLDIVIDTVDNLSTTVDMSAEDINIILNDIDNLSSQLELIHDTQIIFPVSSVNGKTGIVELKISDLDNDLNYLTGYTQTDPIFTANSSQFALASALEDLSEKIDEIQAGDVELTNYYTKSEIDNKKYLTGYTQTDPIFTANSGKFALNENIPTKISQLTNDLNYLISQTDPIFTANSGKFALSSHVNALFAQINTISSSFTQLSSTVDISSNDIDDLLLNIDNLSTQLNAISGKPIEHPILSVNGKTGIVELKISDLDNDLNYLTGYTQTDPVFTANSSQFALASALEDLSEKIDEIQAGDVELTNYYTKSEIDNKNYLTSYTQSDPIFTANSGKFALSANVYTKLQINTMMDNKASLISGKIPASQLPSYVDDVIEGTINLSNNTMTDLNNQSVIIETSKIYIDKNTNKSYRWSGSQFVEISSSLALGETSSTAFAGDRGKALQSEVQQLKTAGYITGQTDPVFTANSGKFALSANVYTKSEIDTMGFATNSVISSTYATKNQISMTNNDIEILSAQVIDILSGDYLSGLNDRLSAMLVSLEQ